MNIEIITSFSESYYNHIGKDCVKTWLEYWPRELSLTCYVEEFNLPTHKRIRQIPFVNMPPEYYEFQRSKEMGGQERKFSKKAFSFIHAMFNSNADRIVWLDADVISSKPFPLNVLESILPNDVLSTHMGVTYLTAKDGTPGRWFVPETGFFAVNTHHPKFNEFRDEYSRRYFERDFTGLRRRYDNDVYGIVFEQTGAKGNDLCAHFEKPYKTPMSRTVLGEYIFHYKAKHSKAGYVSE